MLKSILQGRFMNHPLHPLVVHLPVGLWVASFVFDIVFLVSGGRNFALTSYYCMLIGLIGAGLAVPLGLAEYVEIPANSMPKRIATAHMSLNLVIAALYLVNLIIRHNLAHAAPIVVTSGQFILSVFSLILLSISGYLGGLLVYDYGIGFKPQLRDRTRAELKRAA